MIVVELRINTRLIAMYGVRRIEDGEGPEWLNTYAVSRFFPDQSPVDEKDAPTLLHKYDDPVEQLASRALALGMEKLGPVPRLP